MAAVCLVDTSVFCEILDLRGKASTPSRRSAILDELEAKFGRRETLLLPLATILETGNHVVRWNDGTIRRQQAQRFVEQVSKALEGESPFVPTPMVEPTVFAELLDGFPDDASCGMSLCDVAIRHEFHRQGRRNPSRRVYVWALDLHLSSLDRRVG